MEQVENKSESYMFDQIDKDRKTRAANSRCSDSAGSLVATARRNMERCTMGSAGWWSALDDLRRLENK